MQGKAWIFSVMFLAVACSPSKSVFDLGANQSMLIIGKGPGQDAAVNPYADEESIALVRNTGGQYLYVRIQEGERFLKQEPLMPGEEKEFLLLPGYRLYLDTERTGTKAKVTFSKRKD